MELFMKRMISALLLVVLLLVASGMGHEEMRAEAARPAWIPGIGEDKMACESASYHFTGLCTGDCGHVCWTKGFPYGHCEGFPRLHSHICFCTKPCLELSTF